MTWVVDTCLLIDVLDDDPVFGEPSATLLEDHLPEGLIVCPITYAELAPAFDGDLDLQEEFLRRAGISHREDWSFRDTREAHAAWHRHVLNKRRGASAKRPLADILIGAFALRFDGLLTRNPGDFQPSFPGLEVRVPESP